MLVTESNEWRSLVRDCPPLWRPEWSKKMGEAGLIVGDGVIAPVVIKRWSNRIHVSSPPGEVGMCWASDPYKADPEPERLLDALAEIGATSAFLKEDPNLAPMRTTLTTVELGRSVEIDAISFSIQEMLDRAADRRRIWKRLANWPITLLEGSKALAVRSEFCEAYEQTMGDAGVLSPSMFEEMVRHDSSFVLVLRTPDGQFASAEMVLFNNEIGHVPFGVTMDKFRKESPSVKSLAFAIYSASDLGVRRLNLGGGLEPLGVRRLNLGDGLEPNDKLKWWKLRFGHATERSQKAVVWSLDGQESTDTSPFPKWLEEV